MGMGLQTFLPFWDFIPICGGLVFFVFGIMWFVRDLRES